MDEQLALLVSLSASDLETCRAALASANGDLNLAAQRLTAPAQRCAQCGAQGPGFYGQGGSYSDTFFCQSCWSQWGHNHGDDAMFVDHSEQEDLLQRDLGLFKAGTLEELGAQLVQRLSKSWSTALNGTAEYFAWNVAGQSSWEKARCGTGKSEQREAAMCSKPWFSGPQFPAEVGSEQLWKLLTIYEIQVASQLPRRQNRDAKAVGCTGVACASSSLLGQTEEVDVYIYDYGKSDVVFRLARQGMDLPALLYDPGCTMCPIGIGASGLCVSRFTLYPATEDTATLVGWDQEKGKVGGTPLTAVLWELLLGPRNLPEAVQFLKSLMQEAPPMAGAAMLLMQPGHGACMVEWSPQQISVSPVAEGVVVHANHCISELRDVQSVKISKLCTAWQDSKRRQAAVEGCYAEELLAARAPPLTLKQIQAFLSVGEVQNDDVLATVISCPRERALYMTSAAWGEG
eukprot:Skav202646  [mRNA]  locus=scaffold2784:65684:72200:+ [translate_table: standard]